MQSILSVNNLSYSYDSTGDTLHDVSFDIAPGSYVALAGPNGAGKTTLVKVLLGLAAPYRGDITLFDTPHRSFSDWASIGYLPQHTGHINPLFPATVFEIVRSGLLAGKSFPQHFTKDDTEKVHEALTRVRMENHADTSIHALSGGQTQRVLLARAIVARPKLLILDEPSTALDPETRSHIFSFLKEEHARGVTILMVTHDTAHIGQYADTLLFLDRSVVFFGPFATCCKDEALRGYFGGSDAGEHIFTHPHTH
jgi:zinc transport system ATP-binding protein